MVTFTSYRFGDTVCIDKTLNYRSGEILCEYLNADFGQLEEKRALLVEYGTKLKYPASEDRLGSYIVTLRIVHKLMSSILEIMRTLPPYSGLEISDEPDFVHFAAGHATTAAPDSPSAGPAGPFLPAESTAARLAISEINNYLKSQHKKYVDFCDDLLRVRYVFCDFLDNHFYVGDRFPDSQSAAKALKAFTNSHREASGTPKYLYFTPIYRPYNDYDVIPLADEVGAARDTLCEVVRYYDAGSFLAGELYSGIQTGRLPRRCTCCHRFFLPAPGYGSEFCERVSPGETTKTCREVGARKKYDEKVRSNPVWRIYQRAYKTHYARFMKKKLSQEEFDYWSKYASELRDSMRADAALQESEQRMSLEEYETLIRQ